MTIEFFFWLVLAQIVGLYSLAIADALRLKLAVAWRRIWAHLTRQS